MSLWTRLQGCIDWNRDVLKRELGLEEEDIIDLPILFKLVAGKTHQDAYRALAFYPDMVADGLSYNNLWSVWERVSWTLRWRSFACVLRSTWSSWGNTLAFPSPSVQKSMDSACWRRRCAPWWRAWGSNAHSSMTSPPTTNYRERCTAAPTCAGKCLTSSGGIWKCE